MRLTPWLRVCFGGVQGKKMTFFIDDLSMPEMNKWGDQPTLEMVRLVVEYSGFPFLDKDKRGDFKNCEDLQVGAAPRICSRVLQHMAPRTHLHGALPPLTTLDRKS